MAVVIVDYGMGNLRSVQKALVRVGVASEISSDPRVAAAATGLVLPGVGAFKDAMQRLKASHLDEVVRQHLAADRPFLGICLGMQLLFASSTEDGSHPGLGVLAGRVIRFPSVPGCKVPHMGWNTIRPGQPPGPWHDLVEPTWMYFVHGYYCEPEPNPSLSLLLCDYAGVSFCAGLARSRMLAVQFHPEKSQGAGQYILHNCATLC